LPVAISFGRKLPTIGFDIRQRRVDELKKGHDDTLEVTNEQLASAKQLEMTADPAKLAECTFYIVAVPTPIDINNRPDLGPMISASNTIGPHLKKGDVVVYESTVYPGVTEEVWGRSSTSPADAKRQRLLISPSASTPRQGAHVREDHEGQTQNAETSIASRAVGSDGRCHKAPSIGLSRRWSSRTPSAIQHRARERAGVDSDRMDRTADVLEAAGTRVNFLKFSPGLVGGHCIGVDPYYLTTKAQELGYLPEVILAGRRINNNVGPFLAQKCVKMLTQSDVPLRKAKVGIFGLTFKENVPDLRNSKIPDIVHELATFGIDAMVHDPMGDPREAFEEYKIEITPLDKLVALDAAILAVAHDEYVANIGSLFERVRDGGVVIDVKSAFPATTKPPRGIRLWSL
jgi:UDP-N-acetyl-D-galactosamine dehydrogenase